VARRSGERRAQPAGLTTGLPAMVSAEREFGAEKGSHVRCPARAGYKRRNSSTAPGKMLVKGFFRGQTCVWAEKWRKIAIFIGSAFRRNRNGLWPLQARSFSETGAEFKKQALTCRGVILR
jgi:hypothetical protein